MTNHQGAVMNNKTKKLAVVILAVAGFAGLSGCATTQNIDFAGAAPEQVSKPMPSYGSMGGYRYRRFVAASAAAT
jgi:hypothetical protein